MFQPTFLTALTRTDRVTKTAAFLTEIEVALPWSAFLALLATWKTATVGRKGYTAETMLRMWLIQNFYGLSDEETEDQIIDRASFQAFMKLDAGLPIPDATTLCNFRSFLTEAKLQEQLFVQLNTILEQHGLILKKGTITDATIVRAPLNKSNSEKKWMDEDASSTAKNGQWYRGYKLHTGVDVGSSIIRTAVVTTAKTSDSACFDELLSGDEAAVFADKGYTKKQRKQELRAKGIFCGILEKGHATRKLSGSQEAKNKKLSSVRARGEHQYHIIKNRLRYHKVRYVGLVKNTAHMLGLCMLHNLLLMRKKLTPRVSCA